MTMNKTSLLKLTHFFIINIIIITTHHFQPSSAILDPADFLALQSIRKSLSDMPGSDYFSSWDFTSDPCNFSGVFCSGNHVTVLNLGDPRAGARGLSGELDSAIGGLKNLTQLTIVPGRVSGELPVTLGELCNLRFLGISRNLISGEIPASLGGLVRLRNLDLSYNKLTGSVPWGVGSLTALSNVVLSHNNLSGSIPAFVSQTLTRLDLKHNNFTGSIPPGFLPVSLQYLSVAANSLSGSVEYVLPQLNQLNYLDLSQNRFTGSIPGPVFNFPITYLKLDRNLFSGPVQPFSEVGIETVDLSHNMLYGEVSPLFSTVQNLYLNNNRFTGSVPTTLMDRLVAGNVAVLYLQHNFLTAVPIKPTEAIPVSSSLCLQYNCMVLPVQTPCPLDVGTQKTRPTSQCMEWKG